MAKLKRELTLLDLVVYGVGLILGAGIYVLIGEASGLAGNALWISFVLGALVASFTGLSYAELASIFPKEAAEFVYIKKATGNELLAFSIGWIILVTNVFAAATISLGFANYLNKLTGIPVKVSAIGLILIMSLINFLGIKESSRLNFLFTTVELSGLLLVIVAGLFFLKEPSFYLQSNGISGIISAAALVFFAYLGFEDVVNVSEESKAPRKNVPRALILSIALTSVVYVLVAISSVSIVDSHKLASSEAPLALVVSKFAGDTGMVIMSVIALFATANTALIMLIVASRMLYGMAKEGSLPRVLSKIHKKRGTPFIAIALVAIFSIISSLLNDLSFAASVTNLGAFIVFMLVNLSVIILRFKKPNLERGFKIPLNVGRVPLIPIFGILSCFVLVSGISYDAILIGLGIITVGIALKKIWMNKSTL